jgi:hypothetical protein
LRLQLRLKLWLRLKLRLRFRNTGTRARMGLFVKKQWDGGELIIINRKWVFIGRMKCGWGSGFNPGILKR